MHLGWQVVTAMVRGARPKHDKKETPAPGVQTEMLGGSCAARPTGAKAASDVLTEINSRKEKEHQSSVYRMAPAKQRRAVGPHACPLEGVRCVALGPTTPPEPAGPALASQGPLSSSEHVAPSLRLVCSSPARWRQHCIYLVKCWEG